MNELSRKCTRANEVSVEVTRLFQERVKTAQEKFTDRVKKAYEDVASLMTKPVTPWDAWTNWVQYATDFAQRWMLFWDTIRQRGNNFIEHERAGKPPVLVFKYETVLDGRKFKRPVNYALLKILAPPASRLIPSDVRT